MTFILYFTSYSALEPGEVDSLPSESQRGHIIVNRDWCSSETTAAISKCPSCTYNCTWVFTLVRCLYIGSESRLRVEAWMCQSTGSTGVRFWRVVSRKIWQNSSIEASVSTLLSRVGIGFSSMVISTAERMLAQRHNPGLSLVCLGDGIVIMLLPDSSC